MKSLLIGVIGLVGLGSPLALSAQERENKATSPILKASDLIGYPVKNRINESLGKIEDLAIDVRGGRIQYAVLSFGGFLGMGDKLFAIPFESLSITDEKTAYLDVDKDRLKSAPGFDKANWPNFNDPTWNRDVHKFYGREYIGYDPDHARIRDGMVQEMGYARYRGWEPTSAYVQKFDSKKIEGLTGRVVAVSKVAPMKGMADGVQVTLRPNGSDGSSDQDVIVHLGPTSYWDAQAFQAKNEDVLKLKGSYMDCEGKRVFCASEATKDGRTVKLRNSDGTATWNAEAVRSTSGNQPKGQ